jgi:hypothetical protein
MNGYEENLPPWFRLLLLSCHLHAKESLSGNVQCSNSGHLPIVGTSLAIVYTCSRNIITGSIFLWEDTHVYSTQLEISLD